MGRPAPGTNLFFRIIGDFSYNATSNAVTPVGGLAYLTTAPANIQQVALDPLRAAFYLGVIVAFCAVFSLIWLEVGGLGPQKWHSNSWIQACRFLVTADQGDP